MEDWFRWVAGTVLGVLSLAFGGLGTSMLKLYEKWHGLDVRISAMEQKPQVDPMEYIKAMTEMTAAITTLTLRLESLVKDLDVIAHRVERISIVEKKNDSIGITR